MKEKKCFCKQLFLLSVLICMLFTMGNRSKAISYLSLPLTDSWMETRLYADPIYHRFSISQDGLVNLSYQAFARDTYWELWTEDLTTKIFQSNVYYASITSPITKNVSYYLSKGTYCIKMYTAGGNSNNFGDVRIKGTFVPANTTELEPNNIFGQAVPLYAGVTEKGILTWSDNVDFYRIQVPADGQVSIKMVSSVRDVYITIYSGDYQELFKKNVYYASESEPKTYEYSQGLSAGTYYIKITPCGSSTGYYYLTYSCSSVSSVRLNKASLSLSQDSSATLTATVSPADAVNKTLDWSSSDTTVASVDKNGLVRAKKPGTAVITAVTTDGTNISAQCTVKVIPRQVGGLYVVNGKQTKSSLVLSWNSVSGADGYRVYKYNPSSKRYTVYRDTKQTTLRVSKLAAEKKYRFKVAAYVKSGSSKILGNSSEVAVGYTAPKTLKAPRIISKKRLNRYYYSDTIQLKWNGVSGASGYRVFYKIGANGTWRQYTSTRKRYVQISVSRGRTYYFRVAAYRTKNKLTTQGSYSKKVSYTSR